MRIGSLFSGIDGLGLGLERAGLGPIAWQVESDEFCRLILQRHWPATDRYTDVRDVDWADVQPVDVVCGGFPCQPFAIPGLRQGVSDERWMWPEFARCLRVVRPRYVVVENVPALLADWDAFGAVLADLAALGYDAEWDVLSACAMAAPHTRERLFVVAYTAGELRPSWLAQEQRRIGSTPLRPSADGEHAWSRPGVWLEAARSADRVADGPTHRMVAAGGNAVVPQVAEFIGRLILAHQRGQGVAA